LGNRKIILNEKQLKYINSISHGTKLKSYLKKIDPKFTDFNKFIIAFEETIENKLRIKKSNNYSFDDLVFESIISRLELLNKYKKTCIRIFLECQKHNNYFLTLSIYLNKYFSNYSQNYLVKYYLITTYGIIFQIWIEDDESMDKVMSSLGKFIEITNKIKSFIIK